MIKKYEDILTKEVKRPLSNIELYDMLDKKVKIMDYTDLRTFDNINDVLYPHDCIILLYTNSFRFGHWCCLYKDKKSNTIEHFDSYGIKPDGEIRFCPKYLRKAYGQDIPYLTWILLNSPYKVRYNHHRLQSKKDGIATCGRWCCIRLILKKLNENEFYKLFKKYKDKDLVVTLLTTNRISNI